MKILLVEDDFINRLTVERMLEKKGHDVVPASNGREAISALSDDGIRLVLMDISMPEMDGIEATGLIRNGGQVANPDIPIIAMTAHAMPEDRAAYRQAGMNGFVEKPVDMEELLEAVRQVSEAMARDGGENRPASEPGRNEAESAPKELDRAWLLKRYEGDEDLVAEVYQIYTEDAPLRLEELELALAQEDDRSAVKAVHALKGMSATIGAARAAALAAEIEALGRRGDMNGFRALVPELSKAVAGVMALIQNT